MNVSDLRMRNREAIVCKLDAKHWGVKVRTMNVGFKKLLGTFGSWKWFSYRTIGNVPVIGTTQEIAEKICGMINSSETFEDVNCSSALEGQIGLFTPLRR